MVAVVDGATDRGESGSLGTVADIGTPDHSETESQEAIHTTAINRITIRGTGLGRANVVFGSPLGTSSQYSRRYTDAILIMNSRSTSATRQNWWRSLRRNVVVGISEDHFD
jgi:hypothetical protein